ncbi:hypothetical protein AURDEDRAFT_179803 [Auricularia subglabra TFB-10046 SS5]|nr:hypothetical protein AURDEDRAFT_179803 [Auricularia subglabra TFB-10046 SS5]
MRTTGSGDAITAASGRRSFHNTLIYYGPRPSLLGFVVYFCLGLHHFPRTWALQCADVAQNAVANLKAQGTSWMCCSATEVSCVPWDQSDNCASDHPVYAQCVSANGVKACGVNEYGGISPAQGAPCGQFQGKSAGQDVQSLQGNGKTPVNINKAGQSVLAQWPNLGYENYLSLCCKSDACRLVNPVEFINKNNCSDGEHILKCAGDANNGVCSIWSGDEDSGQFFLVNANPPTDLGGPPLQTGDNNKSLGGPSSTSSAPSQAPPPGSDASSTTSGPATSSTTDPHNVSPPPSPSPPPHVAATTPVWAVALIAGLGGMLVFAALVFLWNRGMCGLNPKYRARTIDPFISPPPSTGLPGYAPPRRRPSDGLLPPRYSAWDTSEGKRMSRSRRYGF